MEQQNTPKRAKSEEAEALLTDARRSMSLPAMLARAITVLSQPPAVPPNLQERWTSRK